MKMSDMYPSVYVSAADIDKIVTDTQREPAVTIASVSREQLGTDMKVVARFVGQTKAAIINPTNGKILAAMFGDDSEMWIGQTITLCTIDTRRPDGTPCRGLSVRSAPAMPAPQPTNGQHLAPPAPAAPSPAAPSPAAPSPAVAAPAVAMVAPVPAGPVSF